MDSGGTRGGGTFKWFPRWEEGSEEGSIIMPGDKLEKGGGTWNEGDALATLLRAHNHY